MSTHAGKRRCIRRLNVEEQAAHQCRRGHGADYRQQHELKERERSHAAQLRQP
jgi:hypothetical protein